MLISEHMPLMAKQMHHMAIIRSMSTREADHARGRYYMHTGYVPDPTIEYPSYGAVVSHELAEQTSYAAGDSAVRVDRWTSEGPGFLGMSYAPFVVDTSGNVRNLDLSMDPARLIQRMKMLAELEKGFAGQKRGEAAMDHAKVLNSTVNLMTSKQMPAFKVAGESPQILERYGDRRLPVAVALAAAWPATQLSVAAA